MRIFGYEIVIRRAPENEAEYERVKNAVWNRSAYQPIRLGDLSEQELRTELAIVHEHLRKGLVMSMARDNQQTIVFQPRSSK